MTAIEPRRRGRRGQTEIVGVSDPVDYTRGVHLLSSEVGKVASLAMEGLWMVPTRMFLTKGVGCHREKLQSLELALRSAKIAHVNIVRVSSIFPPGCRILPRDKCRQHLLPGQIVYAVVSDCATNEPNRQLVASVGVAVPTEKDRYGYLSEHHAFGQTERKASDYCEDLAASMLASTLGISFDPDEDWDQRKQVFRMAGKIVKTRSITQSAKGDKRGYWTTVVAAGVFLSDL